MADPRLYTDFNSCIRPMISNGLITGYRRIVLGALLRHAAKEGTIVDVSIKPFGLRVRRGAPSDEPTPRSLPDGTIDIVDQICNKHGFLTQYKKSILGVAAVIADNDAMMRTIAYSHRTRVMRMKLVTKLLPMQQLVALRGIPHISNVMLVNNPVPFIEFIIGNEHRSTTAYEWPPRYK